MSNFYSTSAPVKRQQHLTSDQECLPSLHIRNNACSLYRSSCSKAWRPLFITRRDTVQQNTRCLIDLFGSLISAQVHIYLLPVTKICYQRRLFTHQKNSIIFHCIREKAINWSRAQMSYSLHIWSKLEQHFMPKIYIGIVSAIIMTSVFLGI